MAPVEAAELAIWTPRFENRSSDRRISQFLRQPQIFRLADVAELGPVLSIMFIQLRPAAEPWPAGEKQQRDQQKPNCEPERDVFPRHYYTATATWQDISE